jgi:ATPase family associated with various cellular activities (AAA)
VDFDLSRLGTRQFEHMIQSLAIAELGTGVSVFGDGRDGGREATFNGTVPIETHGAQWSGYGVIQAKFKQHRDGMPLDQIWFIAQSKKELDDWVDDEKPREPKPDYLILATNVRLSPVQESGGVDTIEELIKSYAEKGLRLKGWDIWHYDKIRTLLENHYEVRRSYAAYVLAGDVIARLHAQLDEGDNKIEEAWLTHTGRALLNNQTVGLGESGDATNAKLSLESVGVDLAATFDDGTYERNGALSAIVARADNVLAPHFHPAGRSRIVMLGGPGQGKSTLARLLAQIYRVALLESQAAGAVGAEAHSAATRMRAAFDEASLPRPTLHRIPVSVNLPTYADEISGGTDISLLRHLTGIVNKGASETLGASDMKKLLRLWPSIVVLDGLDEVASQDVRRAVVERLSDFMGEMAAANADVTVVCTSRPQGFEEALPRDFYDYLVLDRLEAADASHYADRFLRIRHPNDDEQREQVAQRLAAAAQNPATSKLMETPLQVTIMALLLERSTRVPSSRYKLFANYYDVIYQRETNKPGWVGTFLQDQKVAVDALHERAALLIHRRAETAGEAESILKQDALRQLALSHMHGSGWPDEEALSLASKVVDLASERLVLIVPRGDGVGFEVRSLQEFMAARALTVSGDADVARDLQALAASAHWRNAWLLAAGRVFAERLAVRGDLTSIADENDNESLASMLVAPGASLALDLLDDGLAGTEPNYELRLVSSAMRLLDGPPCREILKLVVVMHARMSASQQVRARVEGEVDRRSLVTADVPVTTLAFLGFMTRRHPGPVTEWARHRRDRLADAASKAHPELAAEIEWVANQFPGVSRPGGEAKGFTERVSRELLAAAALEGVNVDEAEETTLREQLSRSVETFDASTTEATREFRDVAANYARDLPASRWTDAEVLRNSLAVAIERDYVAALVAMSPSPSDESGS